MKYSLVGPSTAKPTRGEVLARVETLSPKSQSVKRKDSDSIKKNRSSWGKVLKLGASSSSHVRAPVQALSPLAEILRALSSKPRYGSAAKEKDSLGKAAE